MSQPQQPRPGNERPLTQAETIALLQQAITQLNTVVSKLNTESVENLPSKATIESLVATSQQLANALAITPSPRPTKPPTTQPTQQMPVKVPSQVTKEVSTQSEGLDKFLPSFGSLQTWWDKVLATVRSLLPASLRDRLSDWVLTGILTGSLVAVLLASVLLLPQSKDENVAIQPSPQISPVLPKASPNAVETPPELIAPDIPQPIPLAPPPEPLLTPEQSLIAAIQEEVTELTNQYPEGILSSIEVDFLSSRLGVILEDNWYGLNPSRQDKLASSIWQRSQRLDFRKLEIIDKQGTLIARNPVVGNELVILQRQKINSDQSLSVTSDQ